jgi:hypothetical protein
MTGHTVKNSQGYVVGIADNIPLSLIIQNAQSFRPSGRNPMQATECHKKYHVIQLRRSDMFIARRLFRTQQAPEG